MQRGEKKLRALLNELKWNAKKKKRSIKKKTKDAKKKPVITLREQKLWSIMTYGQVMRVLCVGAVREKPWKEIELFTVMD